jgi:putative CRISPR-associated protein (TIGR02619 family)
MNKTLIVSVVGTSILTNAARGNPQLHTLIRSHANQAAHDDVPAADAAALDALIARAADALAHASPSEAAELSAELNTLQRLLVDAAGAQHHVLISTGTWLGYACAEMVQAWLQPRSSAVELMRVSDLRTTTLEELQLAFADVARWCDLTIPGYRAAGYRIVFNLTGGFKAVQGFMQTLAYFYADETVYTFEGGNLMRIPRLPVKITVDDAVRDNLAAFRRMALGLPVEAAAAAGIAEPLQMVVGHERCLSSWGELVWGQSRPTLYGEQLWPSPSPRVVFGKAFAASAGDLNAERMRILNERIDDAVRFVEARKLIRRLDLKPLKANPVPGSTHEFDAWPDADARRVFCHYEGDVLVLDKLGKPLH